MKILKTQTAVCLLAVMIVGGCIQNRKIADVPDDILSINIDTAQSPKILSGENNPLIDFRFCADPTSVEYNGRLYVYGTDDHQQYENAEKNTYEKIKQLVMISTDDMVNWTYHGIINTGQIAPFIVNSWAPSIIKRTLPDGKTEFFLYFSNSGCGVGVLKSNSPTGPWKSALSQPLISVNTPSLGDCPNPFDPGAVIDNNNTGWLAFGAGIAKNGTDDMPHTGRIVKLGSDMISTASEIKEIPAPYLFEASELNFINNTYVYTYNTSWLERKKQQIGNQPAPTLCAMSYMTTKDPLNSDSWTYRGHYFQNPGDYVPPHTNNHTHLQKYKNQWYLLYHSMYLQKYFNTDGGFRNMACEKIEVDEENIEIKPAQASRQGIRKQLKNINPFEKVEAETVAATYKSNFKADEINIDNMFVCGDSLQCILIKGVDFTRKPREFYSRIKGNIKIDIRSDNPQGNLICALRCNKENLENVSCSVISEISGVHDLYIIIDGKNYLFDSWNFK